MTLESILKEYNLEDVDDLRLKLALSSVDSPSSHSKSVNLQEVLEEVDDIQHQMDEFLETLKPPNQVPTMMFQYDDVNCSSLIFHGKIIGKQNGGFFIWRKHRNGTWGIRFYKEDEIILIDPCVEDN